MPGRSTPLCSAGVYLLYWKASLVSLGPAYTISTGAEWKFRALLLANSQFAPLHSAQPGVNQMDPYHMSPVSVTCCKTLSTYTIQYDSIAWEICVAHRCEYCDEFHAASVHDCSRSPVLASDCWHRPRPLAARTTHAPWSTSDKVARSRGWPRTFSAEYDNSA